MKARDIIAEIRAATPAPERRCWFERLQGEQQQLLEVIQAAWLAGELGHAARPLAPAIAKRFQQAGVQVSPYSVREWLSNLKRS